MDTFAPFRSIFLCLLFAAFGQNSFATSDTQGGVVASTFVVRDEIQKDFNLKSIGTLQISNLRGDIEIKGWAQDRVRLKAVREVNALYAMEVVRLLSALDFRFSQEHGDLEFSAEYGKGLSLEQRLSERQTPRTRMHLQVFAPANLKLSVWSLQGAIHVSNWNANIEARSGSGKLEMNNVTSTLLSLNCTGCLIDLNRIQSSVRVLSGDGNIRVTDVKAPSLYVESSSGDLQLNRVEGEQLLVSKTGNIFGKNLKGAIEFHTDRGNVQLEKVQGSVAGKTYAGNITVDIDRWRFKDKAFIESDIGNVSVDVPPGFNADLELVAQSASRLKSNFSALKASKVSEGTGSQSLRGIVGWGGDQLRVYSKVGNVSFFEKTELKGR